MVCTLDKDTVEASSSFAFELVSDIFAEPSVYRMEFGALATLCNAATSGYIIAESATVAGTQQTVIPIAPFIGDGSRACERTSASRRARPTGFGARLRWIG